MENFSVVLFLLAVVIGLSAVAHKIKISYPILLILAGLVIGFIPQLPDVELDPEIIFLIFLPPLLYEAAFNISAGEFKTNFNTIAILAIPLVFLTATGIAIVAHYLIPGMSWPVSFVLGAILSATDALAAMGITKGLGLPGRIKTILEGESLVNDASALIAYRFAVAAVAGTSFVIWKASLQFLILMGGGVLLGIIISRILGYILSRIKDNFQVSISLMLLMPFVTYLLAEEIHVSGVIAVVALGLSLARFTKPVFSQSLKLQSKSLWDTIIFLLNGLIFILIGLEFPVVVKSINPENIVRYLGYGLIITLFALALRITRVFIQKIQLDSAFKRSSNRVSKHALLDLKDSVIVSWSGMRGVISLAIAIGLPLTIGNGQAFPERRHIIFISVVVVLFTLLGQGLSLPWLVRRLNIEEESQPLPGGQGLPLTGEAGLPLAGEAGLPLAGGQGLPLAGEAGLPLTGGQGLPLTRGETELPVNRDINEPPSKSNSN